MNPFKAIIALTTWKARIATCGLTIYNLMVQCPGFHIVLCLSGNEFPNGEKELPKDIRLMSKAVIVEILWVQIFQKMDFCFDEISRTTGYFC